MINNFNNLKKKLITAKIFKELKQPIILFFNLNSVTTIARIDIKIIKVNKFSTICYNSYFQETKLKTLIKFPLKACVFSSIANFRYYNFNVSWLNIIIKHYNLLLNTQYTNMHWAEPVSFFLKLFTFFITHLNEFLWTTKINFSKIVPKHVS